MKRCPVLLALVQDEIYDVALAMLDGSYWREDHSNTGADAPINSDPHFWD